VARSLMSQPCRWASASRTTTASEYGFLAVEQPCRPKTHAPCAGAAALDLRQYLGGELLKVGNSRRKNDVRFVVIALVSSCISSAGLPRFSVQYSANDGKLEFAHRRARRP